jgi:hypothetical protein
MKKITYVLLIMGVIGILLLGTGCPATEESAGPWTLNVDVGTGVAGSPATGSYSYDDGTMITYDYSLQPKYGNLTVTLDGATVANSGSVNMDNNHDLIARATIDIRNDTWTGVAHHDTEPDWKKYPMRYFKFSGGIASGTVFGEIEGPGNVNGTWTLDGGAIVISLTINGVHVDLVGNLNGTDYMNGTYETIDEHGMDVTGTWYLER